MEEGCQDVKEEEDQEVSYGAMILIHEAVTHDCHKTGINKGRNFKPVRSVKKEVIGDFFGKIL